MQLLVLIAIVAWMAVSGCTSSAQPAPGGQATPTTLPVPFATSDVSGRAAPTGDTCPPGYLVKGGVSPTGERVYVDPERHEYGDIHPEACFTSSSNARAAGYGTGRR
jgi:hypothetical protein